MSRPGQVVIFTDDVGAALSESVEALSCQRVLILTGPSKRFVDRVVPALDGRVVEVFAEAEVHVPERVVERAIKAMHAVGADTLVALGGGSAIGLGKAILLEDDATFIAIPTTYAGSERTSLYGITKGNEKRTGRDPRVRPKVVIYDYTLTLEIGTSLTIQSLLNALAHPIGALATGTADARLRRRALEAITRIVETAPILVATPHSPEARRVAFEVTSHAGEIIDVGNLGEHHHIAHFLGGRFGLPHAALHSMLLPQTLLDLQQDEPTVYAAVADAAGEPDLPAVLYELLRRAGAPTSLRALGVDEEALREALSERVDLPTDTVWRVFEGTPPPRGA